MPEMIKTAKIDLTGLNPRRHFDEQAMEELEGSIKEHGILEALVLRPGKKKGRYDLVIGERRLRAARALELAEVPATIRYLDDWQVRSLMLIENLQRQDLNPLEEARAIEKLLVGEMTQEELARHLSVSQPWIAGRLRLLKAPEKLQELLDEDKITVKHIEVAMKYVDNEGVLEDGIRILEERLEDEKKGPATTREFERAMRDVTKDHTLDLTQFSERAGGGFSEDVWLDLDSPLISEEEAEELSDYIGSDDLNRLFPLADCLKCPKLIKSEIDDSLDIGVDIEMSCPDKGCWEPKLFKVARALANERKKSTEKDEEAMKQIQIDAAPGTVIDTNDIPGSAFRVLRSLYPGCKTCEKYRIDQDKDKICLDPECYQQKDRERVRSENQKKRLEQKAVILAYERWVAKVIDAVPNVGKELEKLLRINLLAHSSDAWQAPFFRAVKLYKKGERKDLSDMEVFASLHGTDLLEAHLWLSFHCLLGKGSPKDIDLRGLKEHFPDAARYYAKAQKDINEQAKIKPASKKKSTGKKKKEKEIKQ